MILAGPMGLAAAFGAVFAAVNLMYSAYCAWTWSKFGLTDYGKYTNMLWNSGHFDWFRYLVDHSYLMTHLSFTLVPIGFLYHLWDHPMVLSIAQWLLILTGMGILILSARKLRIQWEVVCAMSFFYIAYRLTQGVMLSEFHGVCAYFPCVAWLYYCLAFKKNMVAAPLFLMLGVREDAFIIILPMLLYFAIKDRWWMGYVWLLVAIIYGVVAITVVYPAINGYTLFDRRAGFIDQSGFLPSFDAKWFATRGRSLLWSLAPIILFAQRGSLAMWIFPSAALITTLLSGSPTQQSLGTHYGAGIMACLPFGIIEGIACRYRINPPPSERTKLDVTIRALLLVILTVVIHLQTGFIYLGEKNFHIYQKPCFKGRLAMHAARQLPKEGVLVTQDWLCGLTANRPDILSFELFDPLRYSVDYYFMSLDEISRPVQGKLIGQLQEKTIGVRYFDGHYVILAPGADTSRNEEVLEKFNQFFTLVSCTALHGGKDIRYKDGRSLRYWEGDGSRGPINLSFGGKGKLEAGTYDAVFRFRAAVPKRNVRNSWGWLSVHHFDQTEAIKLVDILPRPDQADAFREQRIPFTINRPEPIEFRITGADAELWLDSVHFERHPDETSP